MQLPRCVVISAAAILLTVARPSMALEFDRVVVDANFPDVDQVELADVNGDGRLDIVAIGGGACAWYENPSWTKRVVTGPEKTPGIVSSATADIDGDGKSEIAIAYDFVKEDPRRGKLLLAWQGKRLDDSWTLVPLANIGSIHRLRWLYRLNFGSTWNRIDPVRPGPNPPLEGAISSDIALLAAPLFSPSAGPPNFDQEPARLLTLNFPGHARPRRRHNDFGLAGRLSDPIARAGSVGDLGGGPVNSIVVNRPPVEEAYFDGPYIIWTGAAPGLNSIDVVDLRAPDFLGLLTASQYGITYYTMTANMGLPAFRSRVVAAGAAGIAPTKGASEVRGGRLKDGRRFFVTVEPGEGVEVAAYLSVPNE